MTGQSYMTFELKEKIRHFKGGQSFNNLSSLELEPIVKVLESRRNIEITGYLILSGEFLKQEKDWNEQFERSDGIHYDSFFNKADEEEIETFQYQIPVSFQIEPERIQDISQVFIRVDDFDYIALSDDEMELTAKIKLVGVHPAPSQDNPVDIGSEMAENYNEEFNYFNSSYYLNNYQGDVQGKVDQTGIEEDIVLPTKFDVVEKTKTNGTEEQNKEQIDSLNKGQAEEQEKEQAEIQQINEPVDELTDDSDNENMTKMKIGIKGQKREARHEETTFNSIYSLLKKEKSNDLAAELPTQANKSDEVKATEANEDFIDSSKSVELDQEKIEAAILEEQPKQTTLKKPDTKTKELLYSLVKENEENNYKLKIYFVQKGDTLTAIAEKYNLSINTIIEHNSLEAAEVYEGQLLYLPRRG